MIRLERPRKHERMHNVKETGLQGKMERCRGYRSSADARMETKQNFGTVDAIESIHEMRTVGVGDRETSLRLKRDTVGVTEPLVIETRSSMLERDETGDAVFI